MLNNRSRIVYEGKRLLYSSKPIVSFIRVGKYIVLVVWFFSDTDSFPWFSNLSYVNHWKKKELQLYLVQLKFCFFLYWTIVGRSLKVIWIIQDLNFCSPNTVHNVLSETIGKKNLFLLLNCCSVETIKFVLWFRRNVEKNSSKADISIIYNGTQKEKKKASKLALFLGAYYST